MSTDAELDKILSECFSEDVPIRSIFYKGLFVPDSYPIIADGIENFEVRDDDVWVCSFPKTGTTWTQELVWNIGNDLNFEAAKTPLTDRFPFIEFTGATTTGWILNEDPTKKFPDKIAKSVEYSTKLPSPRYLKTHLPFHLLPRQLRTGEKNCKIVYVARNPKDTCISYYHHYKLLEAYHGSFEDFCKLFLGDRVYYGPFWEHIIGYWERKDDRNMLFLKYEDLKADLPFEIRKIANFLGKTLTDQQIQDLQEHVSFNNMKVNPSLNMKGVIDDLKEKRLFGKDFIMEGEFVRKGAVRQWEDAMSKEIIKQFDDWSEKKLKNFKDLKNEFL